MKTRNTLNCVWFMALMLTFSGCGKKEADKYGQEISNHTITKIEAILKTPGDFDGKTVTVQGKIIRECPTGCWFDVQGAGGAIHVDIKPSGFAIPQKVGKEVIVEGNVSLRDGQLTLIGKGVEIK